MKIVRSDTPYEQSVARLDSLEVLDLLFFSFGGQKHLKAVHLESLLGSPGCPN
jgi:hypothetical protein